MYLMGFVFIKNSQLYGSKPQYFVAYLRNQTVLGIIMWV